VQSRPRVPTSSPRIERLIHCITLLLAFSGLAAREFDADTRFGGFRVIGRESERAHQTAELLSADE